MVNLWPLTVANGIITSITKVIVIFIILIPVVNSHNCFQDYVTVSVGRSVDMISRLYRGVAQWQNNGWQGATIAGAFCATTVTVGNLMGICMGICMGI